MLASLTVVVVFVAVQFWPCDAGSEEHGHKHSGRAGGGVHGDEGAPVPVRRDAAAEEGAGRGAAVEGRAGSGRSLLSRILSGIRFTIYFVCVTCRYRFLQIPIFFLKTIIDSIYKQKSILFKAKKLFT